MVLRTFNRESFPIESFEQWLSIALSKQMKQKLQKFFLKSSELQNF